MRLEVFARTVLPEVAAASACRHRFGLYTSLLP